MAGAADEEQSALICLNCALTDSRAEKNILIYNDDICIHYIILYYIILHYIILYYITLYYISDVAQSFPQAQRLFTSTTATSPIPMTEGQSSLNEKATRLSVSLQKSIIANI